MTLGYVHWALPRLAMDTYFITNITQTMILDLHVLGTEDCTDRSSIMSTFSAIHGSIHIHSARYLPLLHSHFTEQDHPQPHLSNHELASSPPTPQPTKEPPWPCQSDR